MELTQEEIQQIESYLDNKNLVYIDIRTEVLDHMISDIENTMKMENLPFSNAFKRSIQKWYPQLRPSSSWMLGLIYSRPEIVIKKTSKIFLKWFILIMTTLLITAFIETKGIVTIINKNTPLNFDKTFVSLLMISNLFIVYWYIKIVKSRTKSSYLFLFEKQVFYASISFTLVILTDYLSGGVISSSMSLIYIPIIPITTVLGFILFKKHQKFVEKYDRLRPLEK